MILNIEKELDQKQINKILRAKTQEVPISDLVKPETQKLINSMIETMYKANGIGIAAPQIGISKQIIVIETSSGPLPLINPKILKHSLTRISSEEGCLSVPGKFDKLKRWKTVKVRALDKNGKKIELAPNDFTNIILQHEIDHLNGTLFVDRIKNSLHRGNKLS